MKFSKMMFFIVSILSMSSFAFADCKPIYSEMIKAMDGRSNPPRTTMIASAGGAALTPVITAAVGATIAPAALIAAPATALVAGGYLLANAGKKKSLMKALLLIRQAEAGEGRMLERFLDQLPDGQSNREQVISWIVSSNEANFFCQPDGILEIVKPMKYRKILRAARGLEPEPQDD